MYSCTVNTYIGDVLAILDEAALSFVCFMTSFLDFKAVHMFDLICTTSQVMKHCLEKLCIYQPSGSTHIIQRLEVAIGLFICSHLTSRTASPVFYLYEGSL